MVECPKVFRSISDGVAMERRNRRPAAKGFGGFGSGVLPVSDRHHSIWQLCPATSNNGATSVFAPNVAQGRIRFTCEQPNSPCLSWGWGGGKGEGEDVGCTDV